MGKRDRDLTGAEIARTDLRGANGKFIKNPCDLCGKGCPIDNYYSWEHCNAHGLGVRLHARCEAKLGNMSEAEALTLLKAAGKAS